MKKNFTTEIATTKDVADVASLLSWAFGFSKARSQEYIANIGIETLRLMRDEGGRPVVCAGLLQTAHIFHGKAVQAANIMHVAIAPERRGQGIAVPFVDALCDEARSKGAAIATLFASTRPVYRKAGFELAGHEIVYEAATAAFPSASRLAFDRVELDDPRLAGAYDAKTRGESGLLARAAAHWNELRRAPTDALAAYLAEGEVAYLILDMGDKTCLVVRDWFAASPEAAQGLLSFLARFRSVYPAVRWHGAPQDDLVAAMPDKGWRLARQEEWLLRVLHPATALRQRGYHVDQAKLALHIGHAALEIEIRQGVAAVREGCDASGPAVRVDPPAFVQLFTGFRSGSKLAQYGLVAGDSADIRRCDQLFAGPPPWVAEHF
ncbi:MULTISPECIES: GNAT family N-acetyltransferase [unclassified Mesorhizobium]|uniref:GNAT family N-acetyltransferase n=1 Tax=unclassified Mesorhizobium TaxID=325217 RepID=UPI000FE975B0|nr:MULTISPECIES: GNAT family N-acetyltransferase [unclassified Mesorhizobium]RWB73240.1 MAG: GNAT family N-acetyltransferase [Mesorhizobium sp.]RWB90840.1 MAG: GNAT family N-acetyltransferase [Mesorhizobium sp.]RWC10807.1 MAG: GNAT family N-acetyltransferase [Mesorhizobium sp.]TGS64063.1 GNAT family N-acetyltransferase [Mesorhizobium sp. M3A.F.Ca.ET.201.01.1.1]TGS85787.1 GNAT family N-acetyltransferase [Mesorhizobium sp. M3A.F.Ca.ET.175.01.1.1]